MDAVVPERTVASIFVWPSASRETEDMSSRHRGVSKRRKDIPVLVRHKRPMIMP